MGEAIEQLSHFVAGTPWEAIPSAVREHAKLVLLDTIGVILAGSIQPEVAGVRAQLTRPAVAAQPSTRPASRWRIRERPRFSMDSPDDPSSCARAIATCRARAPCKCSRPCSPRPNGW